MSLSLGVDLLAFNIARFVHFWTFNFVNFLKFKILRHQAESRFFGFNEFFKILHEFLFVTKSIFRLHNLFFHQFYHRLVIDVIQCFCVIDYMTNQMGGYLIYLSAKGFLIFSKIEVLRKILKTWLSRV